MKKNFITIGLLIALCATSCSNKPETAAVTEANNVQEISDNKQDEEETAETTDAVTGATELKTQLTLNGTIIAPPQRHSTLTLIMGGALQSISVFAGDYVRKGQVIATMKNPEFIRLQQEFLTASAQTEYLEKEYLRQEKLASQEAASQKKFQQSKADYMAMKSQMEAAKAQLEILGIDTKSIVENGISAYMEIKAPISGYVTELDANLGMHFNAGDALCHIIDKQETMLLITAYEKDLGNISVGNDVRFTVNGMPGKEFQASIISIDQMVDNENRSINVYAKVSETNELFRPGMYVNAKVDKNM